MDSLMFLSVDALGLLVACQRSFWSIRQGGLLGGASGGKSVMSSSALLANLTYVSY